MGRPGLFEWILFRRVSLFEVGFFVLATWVYWTFLACLCWGIVSEPTRKDWFAAIGGSLFFPSFAILAFREWQRSRLTAQFEAQLFRDRIREQEEYSAMIAAQLPKSLIRKVDFAEAEALVRGELPRPESWVPMDECDWDDFQDFIAKNLTDADELWLYDLPLNGSAGLAVVHASQIKDVLRLS